MIPYGRQNISQDDIDHVIKILKSDFLTQGEIVPLFEKKIAKKVGAKYGVAVNSATSALHISCLALGLEPGDILWTSPITFVASANCGLYCGAKVDFVDIDPITNNICPKKLEEKLILAEHFGQLPKILVAVHLSGQSCQMQKIYNLSKQYGFKVIEDASHAIGGKYKSAYIGSCEYSDITVFSFHPVKIITTGEGGMAMTNKHDLAEKMERLRSHGITRNEKKMTHPSDGPWYYQQIDLGFNYRMTEIQAALGLSQINRLDEFVLKRNIISDNYNFEFENLPLSVPTHYPECYSARHLYIIRLDLTKINKTHNQVFKEFLAMGIGVNIHYIPVHLQPFYQKYGFKNGDFPEAEKFYESAITLPLYPDLSLEQQGIVINSAKSILGSIHDQDMKIA